MDVKVLRRIGQLPTLFEHLAQWYAWLDVDLGVCRLFANPPSADCNSLVDAMFHDERGMISFYLLDWSGLL